MVLVTKWRDHGVAIESDGSRDRHAVGRTELLTLCVPKRESISVAVATHSVGAEQDDAGKGNGCSCGEHFAKDLVCVAQCCPVSSGVLYGFCLRK